MATHDLDQKLLGRLAVYMVSKNQSVAHALRTIFGISVQLTARLRKARKVRKLESPRDTKNLDLYHRVIFLSREGLYLLEHYVLDYADGGQGGSELRIFALKLRASFYHIFCLFHNTPPIALLPSSPPAGQTSTPLSPRHGNGQRRRTSPRSSSPKTAGYGQENIATARTRVGTLREQIPSMASETSYVTNPYAAVSPPPGIHTLVPVQNPESFLLPALNYVPMTRATFENAAAVAAQLLPACSPLRLSVTLELCAFLWDCCHDHDGCRRLARKTIRDVYASQDPMTNEEFDDAAILVGTLGRMMRRKATEGTPRFGDITPPGRGSSNGRSAAPTREQTSTRSS